MGRADSLMDVKGKRVLVVGLGKSGIASALFLADQGARVAVSDTKSPEELHHEIPQLMQARQAGIPVIGEVELAARYLKGRIIAITGSNGKTTTTALTGEIIAAGGKHTLVGGNIGTPAVSLVGTATDDSWIVLEVSSFQLETIETFHPRIAVVLNI